MGWERYALAAGPVLIFQIATIQTLAVFDDQLLAFLIVFKDWQALIAALLAIGGIGWQVERQGRLAREQMAHTSAIAEAERLSSQRAIARMLRGDIVAVLIDVTHNRGALEGMRSFEDTAFLHRTIAEIWRNPAIARISSIGSEIGGLGSVFDTIWMLLKSCEQLTDIIADAKKICRAADRIPDVPIRSDGDLQLIEMHKDELRRCGELAVIALTNIAERLDTDFNLDAIGIEDILLRGSTAAQDLIEERRSRGFAN
ncbi:hypothetical protein [Parvibaculum sp.]|uniref:hypothetical protein n=1 Tax=Parvibaculum sp. TaxID=2024848 RepID=UPI00391D08CE